MCALVGSLGSFLALVGESALLVVLHTLKTHHTFRNLKGKGPGTWAGVEANGLQVERAEIAVRGSPRAGLWELAPGVITLEAPWGSGNGGVDSGETAGSCNALLV